MKKVVRVFNTLLTIVLILALVFSAYVFITVLRAGKDRVPSVFGYSFLRVATGSMEPTIPTGSLIVVQNTDASSVKVDDVICFYSPDPSILNKPNTHRVIEIRQEEGETVFVTKGDANTVKDSYTVSGDRLVGVYRCTLPVGKLLDLLHNQYFFFFALLVPICCVIFFEFLHLKKVAAKKEEPDAQEE